MSTNPPPPSPSSLDNGHRKLKLYDRTYGTKSLPDVNGAIAQPDVNGAIAQPNVFCQASSSDCSSAKRKRVDECEFIDQNYFRSYADIAIHQEMIGDHVRTTTYRQAILNNKRSICGKVVADIGAGTGILSMFCVQAGAKKVYAIEASEMAEQAKVIIRSNDMQNSITVIHGKVEDCELPEKVDVIVSEWMGHMLVYESMLSSVIYARDKWLKQGGVMLPNTAELFLAPLSHTEQYMDSLTFWDEIPPEYKINMSAMKPYARKCLVQRVHIRVVNPQDIVSRQFMIGSFNLGNITTLEMQRIKSDFSFVSFGRVTVSGFVSWFKVIFPCTTVLSTSPFLDPTHWQQSVILVQRPLSLDQDDVLHGSIEITPNAINPRFIEIDLCYNLSKPKCNINLRTHCSMTDFMY